MDLKDKTLLNLQRTLNKTPATKTYELADRDGMSVRVSPQGTLTFQYRYRFGGKPQRISYGQYPDLSLEAARKKHDAARKELAQGKNPSVEKRKRQGDELKAPTVKQLCDRWKEEYANKFRKRPEIAEQIIDSNIESKIGRFKVKEINRAIVNSQVLDPIVQRDSPVQANKTLTLMKQIFQYGLEKGYIDVNPCAAISKKNVGGVEIARDRFLEDEEIKKIWLGIDKTDIINPIKLGIKLLLVTGQRRCEVTNAKWSDLDLEKRIWSIPAELSKNGKAHKVPLSALAIELLNELKLLAEGADWVLPSPKDNDKPVSQGAITRAVNRHQDELKVSKWIPHDLRRTAATKMNEIGIPPYVVEKILNHQMEGVMAVYNRHDYWDECVDAMNQWANRLNVIIKSDDKVIPFKRAANGN